MQDVAVDFLGLQDALDLCNLQMENLSDIEQLYCENHSCSKGCKIYISFLNTKELSLIHI